MDSNHLNWIFSPVLYQLGYFHIKEQVTGFEPVIFGLEDRRDKPTTLNLQKSSPSKIRTYTTQIQSLVHYQLCYRRINLALVGIAPTIFGL